MSLDALNEQQRAELEAASYRLTNIVNRMQSLETTLATVESAIKSRVALLNTLPGAQTYIGEFHFGDDLGNDPSQGAKVIIGPASSLQIFALPRGSYDAVPKAYVDNIVSPLSAQLAKNLGQKVTTFATWAKNGASTNLNLTAADLISQSDDAQAVFALHDTYVEFLSTGTYVISWHVASASLASTLVCTLMYNGNEVSKMYVASDSSDTITLTLRASKNTILSWQSVGGFFTSLSHLLSIVRMGE